MRLVLILLTTMGIVSAQTIATKVLTPGTPIKISLSPALTTTLLFPGPLSGTFGLGLLSQTTAQSASSGSVQIEHPDVSPIVVLHALNESAAVTMTILLDGKLYVFDLRSAPNPDVAVTLVRDCHEISVSSYGTIRTNCIVPFSVERVGTNIDLCDLLF